MKLKTYIFNAFAILITINAFAQYGAQKKADNLFNTFSFANATEVYHKLIEKNFNTEYATRQLADSYAYMRNADSAVVYYEKVVKQNNAPTEYLYKYAQVLRAVGKYNEARTYLQKFKQAGGTINTNTLNTDKDFLNTIFNAKQQYFLKDVKFNSKYSDFGAYQNNGTIYFTSSRTVGASTKHVYGWDNEPFLDIYTTNSITDSIVNNKSKLKGKVNSVYHDGPVTITKNGKTMYFSRTSFKKNKLDKDNNGTSNLKIYKATLDNGSWTNIEELSFNNNAYSNAHPALNHDETKLYFASDMPGGIGGSDIYYVEILENGTYSKPVNLGNTINTEKNERFPFVNSEGTLFFASDGHPGLGMLDIFAAVKNSNNSTNIVNLGIPVNSSKDDFSFFMNENGLTGFFASNRHGGVGGDDIYAFDRIPQLILKGHITDASTNTPVINAKVILKDYNGHKIAELTTDENGNYEINVDRDTDYMVEVTKDNFIDNATKVSTKNIEKSTTTITNNVSLQPVPIKETPSLGNLNTIYFDFNASNIRKDSSEELDKIAEIMLIKFPNIDIKIESHTDSRGPSSYNKVLSQKRANATFNYLVSKGVPANRIKEYTGYGEEQLVNNCNNTTKCNEAEHQLNRRTQFIIITSNETN
ncbi:OmpA family protein [Seonamhaeicola algicola]|uniref:OmpA family protein n=1 Tax=Seonamhaeicola algicola TaxID=1719036 RepID=A0A5C7B5P3_9FLAO|nr:OmpA family protein [Seonamhaeicola algicola]TXE15233.1 OmpA family protein [Seonamhaeicola algicola]